MNNSLHRLKHFINYGLTIKLWRTRLIFNITWLLLILISLWIITTIYVPVMGSGISRIQAWGVSFIILVLIFISFLLHVLMHLIAGRVNGSIQPERLNLIPIGEPSQCWLAARHPGREAVEALAGPLVNGIIAALFYFLWNWQINTFVNVISTFLIFFNLAMMWINLIPAFPFDGGRLVRAVAWWLLGRIGLATRLATGFGWGISIGLIGWGIILLAQQSRYSLENAGAVFVFAVLITGSLYLQKGWQGLNSQDIICKNSLQTIFRSFLVLLLLIPQIILTLCLIPVNDGLKAPGFTASVEPMIQLPTEYRHDSKGKLFLTSVISQTPILFGEWLYAHLDNSIQLIPPEEIIPEDETQQSISEEHYQMLLNSEEIAIIVGLQLAGYTVDIHNDGISVIAILPTSLAVGVLQPDDIITGINSNPVFILEDLTMQLDLLIPGATVNLTINRNGQTMDVSVTTIASENAGGHARIGISIVQHTSGYTLPFPIKIDAQKVLGGPSAGLMFTLGVYDILTQEDLTKGRIIAGTGTIDINGNVGAIGGVQQKIVAAERAGAEYFFSPKENYADAISTATRITVIKVETVQEALDFLRSRIP